MKVTAESTAEIVEVNGVPARVWRGKTENGTEIFMLVSSVGVSLKDDPSEFLDLIPMSVEVDLER